MAEIPFMALKAFLKQEMTLGNVSGMPPPPTHTQTANDCAE